VACADDRTCGQASNLCIVDIGGNGYCGFECNNDHDCPLGASCYQIDRADGKILGFNCFPTANVTTPYNNACTSN